MRGFIGRRRQEQESHVRQKWIGYFKLTFSFLKKREVLALGLVICAAKEALIELA